MKSGFFAPSMRGILLGALALTIALPASAYQDEEVADPTPEQAQAYNDAQSCVAVLRKVGGAENEALAEASLERARELAAVNGHTTEEAFQASLKEMAQIIDLASAKEMKAFTAACQSGKY